MPTVKNPFRPSRPRETEIAAVPQPTPQDELASHLDALARDTPERRAGNRAQAALVSQQFNAKLEAHEKWKREKAEHEAAREAALLARIQARQVAL